MRDEPLSAGRAPAVARVAFGKRGRDTSGCFAERLGTAHPRLPSARPFCPMRYCGAILNAIEYWFTSGAVRLKNTRPSIGERNVSRTLPSNVSRTSASA